MAIEDQKLTSPTCVVEFADGQVTRMTTWSKTGKPDARRGIKLARYAYESRMKRDPPEIKDVYFEIDGVQGLPLTAEDIAKASK